MYKLCLLYICFVVALMSQLSTTSKELKYDNEYSVVFRSDFGSSGAAGSVLSGTQES